MTGTLALRADGNELANVLMGNGASNELAGYQGVDTLIGGAGDDFYFVNGTSIERMEDVVIEAVGEGYDTIFGNVWSAALPAHVEAFVLGVPTNSTIGGWERVFRGNELDNMIDVRSDQFDSLQRFASMEGRALTR